MEEIKRNGLGQFAQSREDMTGKRFGRLVALSFSHKNKSRKTYWNWLCDCGNIIVARTDSVKSGAIQSCGCLHREVAAQTMRKKQPLGAEASLKDPDLGPTITNPLYTRWQSMKDRCYNKNNHHYHRYGGRGITMCDDWTMNFRKFYDWAMANGYDPTFEIHRIDNDKGYSPDNCIWLPRSEHAKLHKMMRQHRGNLPDCEQAEETPQSIGVE